MSGFFSTSHYKFLKELMRRIKDLNTENNFKIYEDHKKKCIKLCRDKYANVGYREDTDSYAWDKLNIEEIGPRLNNCGGYNDGLSFIEGSTIYMSDDCKTWAIKDSNGTVTRFEPSETSNLHHHSIKQLQKVFYAKCEFEGKIVSTKELLNEA